MKSLCQNKKQRDSNTDDAEFGSSRRANARQKASVRSYLCNLCNL